ncbi:hypothetical protein SAMN04515618_12827 [Collimonas sp. OK307]|nr:hypothetical protein SAMN04515618_12827 [Collimonas sp. OK307]
MQRLAPPLGSSAGAWLETLFCRFYNLTSTEVMPLSCFNIVVPKQIACGLVATVI